MAEIAMANDDFRNSITWQIFVPNFMIVSTSEIFGEFLMLAATLYV